MNSFLTTYVNHQQALSFGGYSSKNPEKILFEIEADPRYSSVKPFADVTSFCMTPEQPQILFMAGSSFFIHNVNEDENNKVWIVQMSLSAGNDADWKTFFTYMQKMEDKNEKLSIISFGHILRRMDKLDAAENYYLRLLAEIYLNKTMLETVYNELGKIAASKGDSNALQKWNQKLANNNMTILTFNVKTTTNNTGKIY